MHYSSTNKTPRTNTKFTPQDQPFVKSPSLKSWESHRRPNDHYEVTFFESKPISKQRSVSKGRTNSLPRQAS